MHNKVKLVRGVEASTAIDAACRLLSQGVANRSPVRALCRTGPFDLTAAERLRGLVQDGDFVLNTAFDAAADWRGKANAVFAAGEAIWSLGYEWGTFDISCWDSTIRMRRYGDDRRLMRQGVGMYVRRHFRSALRKDGWGVADEGRDVTVARDGQIVGSFQPAPQNKFMEHGSLKLSPAAQPQLLRLLEIFLDEIGEDPDRLSLEVRGTLSASIELARMLGVAEKTCFEYGAVGSSTGFVLEGQELELMRVMVDAGSDGDFVSYPDLRCQDPEAEGEIFMTLNQGKWTVEIVLYDEVMEPSPARALAAMVARFESASS